ncbi:MAG: hypothetical protein M3144_09615 [Actinomycetota bacterium]|nr:hypothetical protein [Actinomycetota bacterium]
MFKRLFWLSVGTALGLGGSLWAQRRFRRQIERYKPDEMTRRAVTRVRGLRADVRAAARQGRDAMREREEMLRSQYRPPGTFGR